MSHHPPPSVHPRWKHFLVSRGLAHPLITCHTQLELLSRRRPWAGQKTETHNSWDSTTNQPACGLCTANSWAGALKPATAQLLPTPL